MATPLLASADKLNLLVVDEDAVVRSACCEIATKLGFVPQQVSTLAAARALLSDGGIDILLLDLRAPTCEGLELLNEITTCNPDLAVVVMTVYAPLQSVIELMRTGVADYLSKPFGMDELVATLQRAEERRNLNDDDYQVCEDLRSRAGLGNIICRSPEMQKLCHIVGRVAQGSHPVLILGESGTGKELVARTLHANGLQRSRQFVQVDCSSLVDGIVTMTDGGTVLLDEIGELPLDLQSKLLHALQENKSNSDPTMFRVPVKVRILAASSGDLLHLVESGRFRRDLYHRLNLVNLRIPPLRDRPQDVPLLAAHFLDRISRETGVNLTLSKESLRTMAKYEWPGNVRELENVIERASILSSGPILHVCDLPTQLQTFQLASRRVLKQISTVPQGSAVSDPVLSLAELEKRAILDILRKFDGDKVKTARLLGIGKTTLYRKVKEYGIDDVSLEVH